MPNTKSQSGSQLLTPLNAQCQQPVQYAVMSAIAGTAAHIR